MNDENIFNHFINIFLNKSILFNGKNIYSLIHEKLLKTLQTIQNNKKNFINEFKSNIYDNNVIKPNIMNTILRLQSADADMLQDMNLLIMKSNDINDILLSEILSLYELQLLSIIYLCKKGDMELLAKYENLSKARMYKDAALVNILTNKLNKQMFLTQLGGNINNYINYKKCKIEYLKLKCVTII